MHGPHERDVTVAAEVGLDPVRTGADLLHRRPDEALHQREAALEERHPLTVATPRRSATTATTGHRNGSLVGQRPADDRQAVMRPVVHLHDDRRRRSSVRLEASGASPSKSKSERSVSASRRRSTSHQLLHWRRRSQPRSRSSQFFRGTRPDLDTHRSLASGHDRGTTPRGLIRCGRPACPTSRPSAGEPGPPRARRRRRRPGVPHPIAGWHAPRLARCDTLVGCRCGPWLSLLWSQWQLPWPAS